MIEKPKLRTSVPDVSEELFIRVNDLIEQANRIGRRYDSAHALTAMSHAFARYAAYHFRNTVKNDSPEEREAFVVHMADTVKTLVRGHLSDMAGELPRPAAGDVGQA